MKSKIDKIILKGVIQFFLSEMSKQDNKLTAFPAFYVIKEPTTKKESSLFLTETDAIEHLESNPFLYDKDAYIYLKHAYKSIEFKNFLSALFLYFEIDLPPQ